MFRIALTGLLLGWFPIAAHAAFISTDTATAPATLFIHGPSTTLRLDLLGTGTPDVTVSSTQGQSLSVQADQGQVSWSGFYALPYPTLATFQPTTGPGFTPGLAPIANFVDGQLSSDWPYDPGYLEIIFDTGRIGYIEALLTLDPANTNAKLDILDYGNQVPEPASFFLFLTSLACAEFRRRANATLKDRMAS